MANDAKNLRMCACDCGLSFTVSETSRRIYLNLKHKQIAKEYRRKLRRAGVKVETSPQRPFVKVSGIP